jgi:hypothetical protein
VCFDLFDCRTGHTDQHAGIFYLFSLITTADNQIGALSKYRMDCFSPCIMEVPFFYVVYK